MKWFFFTFTAKMRQEAEIFLKKPQKTKEVEARYSSQDQHKTSAAGWSDNVKEKTEWSTDSEDEVSCADFGVFTREFR